MPRSAWLMGSREWTEGQTITIAGDPQTIEAELGGLYLDAPQADVSLLAQVQLAMTAAGLDDCTAELLRNRKVRLSSSDNFVLSWGTGTLVRDLLGFTSPLAGLSSYTAPNISPLLWSPGKTETPKLAPLGVVGGYEFDIAAPRAWGGLQVARQHGPPTRPNEYEWQYLRRARYWANDPPAAGEFAYFFANTLVLSHRWLLWRDVDESDSSTDPAVLDPNKVLGPYAMDLQDKRSRRLVVQRSPGFALVEAAYDVTIVAIQQPEFGQI